MHYTKYDYKKKIDDADDVDKLPYWSCYHHEYQWKANINCKSQIIVIFVIIANLKLNYKEMNTLISLQSIPLNAIISTTKAAKAVSVPSKAKNKKWWKLTIPNFSWNNLVRLLVYLMQYFIAELRGFSFSNDSSKPAFYPDVGPPIVVVPGIGALSPGT